MKKVYDLIEKYKLIDENQHIVIGLSGGPDSVCLFHLLDKLAGKKNLKLYPVHINHKLRPGAAEQDQAYVEKLCKAAGWPARVFTYDCNEIAAREKMTSEEAGRKVRYKSFETVCQEIVDSGVKRDMVRIAVAQNADDQAETILFRIMRGTGTDGLSGMDYARFDEQGNKIIRPLLETYKEDILKYCEDNNLNPCIDKTNSEAIYTRNKIRLNLIPYLKQEYNENIKDTIIRIGKNAASDKEYLWNMARESFERIAYDIDDKKIMIKGDEFREMHQAMQKRVISIGLAKLGLYEDVSYANFESCFDILESKNPSARADLPKGYYFTKVYGDFKIGKTVEAVKPEIKTSIMSIEEYREGKRCGLCSAFDFDKLEAAYGENFFERVHLDTRRPGDYITIEHGKKKKIQDYFVDRKIPKDDRDSIFLLKMASEVLWALPYNGKGRRNAKYCLDNSTKKVFNIEIICVI